MVVLELFVDVKALTGVKEGGIHRDIENYSLIAIN